MLKAIVVALSLGLLATATEAQSQKFRVNDPVVASRLLAQGGKLIADYGAFKIIEANAASAAGESNRVESVEEDNFIELHAARLDTRTPTAKSLRKAVAPKPGRQLHLVQFAGPIKPEWRALWNRSAFGSSPTSHKTRISFTAGQGRWRNCRRGR